MLQSNPFQSSHLDNYASVSLSKEMVYNWLLDWTGFFCVIGTGEVFF